MTHSTSSKRIETEFETKSMRETCGCNVLSRNVEAQTGDLKNRNKLSNCRKTEQQLPPKVDKQKKSVSRNKFEPDFFAEENVDSSLFSHYLTLLGKKEFDEWIG